jgi:chromosome segregation ATPase
VVAAVSELDDRLAAIEARVATLQRVVDERRQALAKVLERRAQLAAALPVAQREAEGLQQRVRARRAQYEETEKRCYERVKGGVDVLFKAERER